MLAKETYLNRTEDSSFGESEPYETWTEDTGKLFRSYQREFGRCVSKVYVDVENGPPIACGWVFQSRDKYQDDPGATYLREVWVTLYNRFEKSTVVESKLHAL